MRSAMANSQNTPAMTSVNPTAADPMSLTCLICWSRLVVSRSASFSIAVLRSSTTRISMTAQTSSTRRMVVAPVSHAKGSASTSTTSSSRTACSERTAKTRPLRELMAAFQSRSKSESRHRRNRFDLAATLLLEQLRNQESHVDRLFRIEAGVADRVIAVVEILLGDGARAADAFGNVLAGHFQMNAAGMGALRGVDREEILDLRQNPIERAGFVTGGGGHGVAMHRVARPHHHTTLALHGTDQGRQVIGDLFRAEAADQRQPARLILRVEHIDQLDELIGLQRRAAFQADRVLDAAEIFDMAMVELPRAIADPDKMAGGCIPIPGRGIDPRHCLLVAEQQGFVAGVEVGRAQLG